MLLLYSFLYCGFVCGIAQIILDNTKLTVGHITSIFVVVGSLLEVFGIYDNIIDFVGGGAMLPIVSFGHSLTHASLYKARDIGFLGIFSGVFDLTGTGISIAIILSFFFYVISRPKN